jgi:hypothetical protein
MAPAAAKADQGQVMGRELAQPLNSSTKVLVMNKYEPCSVEIAF